MTPLCWWNNTFQIKMKNSSNVFVTSMLMHNFLSANVKINKIEQKINKCNKFACNDGDLRWWETCIKRCSNDMARHCMLWWYENFLQFNICPISLKRDCISTLLINFSTKKEKKSQDFQQIIRFFFLLSSPPRKLLF